MLIEIDTLPPSLRATAPRKRSKKLPRWRIDRRTRTGRRAFALMDAAERAGAGRAAGLAAALAEDLALRKLAGQPVSGAERKLLDQILRAARVDLSVRRDDRAGIKRPDEPQPQEPALTPLARALQAQAAEEAAAKAARSPRPLRKAVP